MTCLVVRAVDDEFEAWYRQEHRRVLASVVLVFGDVDLARDSTDEAFARAAAAWGRVGRMHSPGGWVLRVALNVARRTTRRAALEQRLLRRSAPVTAWVPAPIEEVWESVRVLPRRQRTAVVLRYVADLPEAEIASVMGVRRGTVASTLHDARRALAALLVHDAPEARGEDDPCLGVRDARA